MMPATPEERKSLVAICKAAWFLIATAGQVIAHKVSNYDDVEKSANEVGKRLDKFLKDA